MASVQILSQGQFTAPPAFTRTRVRANGTHLSLFMYVASLSAWSYDVLVAMRLLVG